MSTFTFGTLIKYILMYFDNNTFVFLLEKSLNAELLLVAQYFYTVVILLLLK